MRNVGRGTRTPSGHTGHRAKGTGKREMTVESRRRQGNGERQMAKSKWQMANRTRLIREGNDPSGTRGRGGEEVREIKLRSTGLVRGQEPPAIHLLASPPFLLPARLPSRLTDARCDKRE